MITEREIVEALHRAGWRRMAGLRTWFRGVCHGGRIGWFAVQLDELAQHRDPLGWIQRAEDALTGIVVVGADHDAAARRN